MQGKRKIASNEKNLFYARSDYPLLNVDVETPTLLMEF